MIRASATLGVLFFFAVGSISCSQLESSQESEAALGIPSPVEPPPIDPLQSPVQTLPTLPLPSASPTPTPAPTVSKLIVPIRIDQGPTFSFVPMWPFRIQQMASAGISSMGIKPPTELYTRPAQDAPFLEFSVVVDTNLVPAEINALLHLKIERLNENGRFSNIGMVQVDLKGNTTTCFDVFVQGLISFSIFQSTISGPPKTYCK